jgi:hypothetical protein
MEKLLRDSFANYVIQTCLDYAEPDQRAKVNTAFLNKQPLLNSS